jgi:hypothetical protein
MSKYIIAIIITLIFNGCFVGDVVALPFRITGAVVNVVTPDIVGDSITTTGDAIDTAIPF